jgi:voltage-gated potassium channel
MREFNLFIRHLFAMICFVRGVLAVLLVVLLVCALVVAKVDGLPISDAIYLTLITALTVGYGDITPSTGIAKIVSVLSGLIGVIIVGLVVAISTRALHLAADEERQFREQKDRAKQGH